MAQHRQLEIEISSKKKDQMRVSKKALDLLLATRPQGRLKVLTSLA
jgi:hypothetical protein